MPVKKIGRPTDNPKSHRITVRLDDKTYLMLQQCCEGLDLDVSAIIREGIFEIHQALGRANRKKE